MNFKRSRAKAAKHAKAKIISSRLYHAALEEVAQATAQAMETVANELPPGFPEKLHASVQRGLIARLLLLE
ncbi:MAG: hypothetical protein WCI40_01230 [Verrucomicrobiota bacterium]